MSERTKTRLRLLFIVLAVANVLVFTFFKLRPDPNEAAALRIKEVQINAGSVKLLAAKSRGAGEAITSAKAGGDSAACLEWGPISSGDVTAAEGGLDKLALAAPAIRRPAADTEGGGERFVYFLREPEKAVVAQIAELQRTFPGTQIRAGKCPDDLAARSASDSPPR
jgi:hypothetical protein